jgi:hypothetical protein
MDLQGFITAALASGCGAIIQWLFSLYAADRADAGKPISPRTKRRVMIGLCIVVPSALVGILYLATGRYDWQQHLMAVGLAFVTSQAVHGEQKLMTGEEVRAAARLEQYTGTGGGANG